MDLETVTASMHPVIHSAKKSLMAQGAAGALMSGSGPTVFGLFPDREQAEKAVEALSEHDAWSVGSTELCV